MQIENLSSDDLDDVECSLIHLSDELKNGSQIPFAIKLGIIEKLYEILSQVKSFSKPIIMPYSLEILGYIALNSKGAYLIAKDKKLLRLIFNLMRTQSDLNPFCCELLLTLSADVIGENRCY